MMTVWQYVAENHEGNFSEWARCRGVGSGLAASYGRSRYMIDHDGTIWAPKTAADGFKIDNGVIYRKIKSGGK